MASRDNNETPFEYQLLDTGYLRRLEQVGPYRVIRPSLNAFWTPSLPKAEWDQADAEFVRNPQASGGKWMTRKGRGLPSVWKAMFKGLRLQFKPTNFGHLGVFPEHSSLWPKIEKLLPEMGDQAPIMNLFAYTGALSLHLAKCGAKVTHCDAAQGIVDWARENLALNPEIGPVVRWIVDDAFRFVAREERRGTKYRGIILDPPSFGRGAQGQVWKIEEALPEFLAQCKTVLATEGTRFIILTCHTPGFTPIILERMLKDAFRNAKNAEYTSGELCITQAQGEQLPSGAFAQITLR